MVKNLPANAGDTGDEGSIPGWGRSPGVGNGNLLHYSCLKNSMDRGVWWATVHGVTKNGTWLRDGAKDTVIVKKAKRNCDSLKLFTGSGNGKRGKDYLQSSKFLKQKNSYTSPNILKNKFILRRTELLWSQRQKKSRIPPHSLPFASWLPQTEAPIRNSRAPLGQNPERALSREVK